MLTAAMQSKAEFSHYEPSESTLTICAVTTLNSGVALLQMYLLQSPLRPPWRPYDLEAAESVRPDA